MKKLIVLAGICIGFAACQQNNKVPTFSVKGVFANTGSDKIYLAELPFGSQERSVVDTATLDAKGHFELSTPSKGEGVYQLFVDNGPGIMLIKDAEELEINADANQLSQYTIRGGNANMKMKKLYGSFLVADSVFRQRRLVADSLAGERKADSAFGVARQQADASLQNVQGLLADFIRTEGNGSAVYFALGMARAYTPAVQWDSLLNQSLRKFPQHPGIALLKLPEPQQEAGAQQPQQGTGLIGQVVPNISLPDTSGKLVAVSDFRGKWLLVDFWASWCQPCRAENPNVLAAYKQFRNRNFAILGVSLDKTKAAWTKAIRQDGLTWAHISDLKYWDSQAVTTYGFNAIPFNLLVSPEGKVVATDLHEQVLQQTLNQYLNQPEAAKKGAIR